MAEYRHPVYCDQCGSPVQAGDRFCGECGARVAPVTPEDPQIIPEPVVAAQGATVRNNRRMLFLAGAVGVLLLLLVGGGAVALLGSNNEERSGPSEDQPEKVADTPEEPEEYGTTEPTTPSSTALEPSWMSDEEIASLEEFGREYDEAARREDWEATYSMLDETSRQEFTEEEWVEIQQVLRDASGPPAPLESVSVEQKEVATDVPVTVRLHYEDGTEETMIAGSPMAVEVGEYSGPRRYLTEEEISELKQLSTTGPTTDADELEAEVEEAVEDYYLAVDREDWIYTYENLDFESKALFTQEEWSQKNQWIADNEDLELSSIDVDVEVAPEGFEADVTVDRTFKDGTSITRDTIFVHEDDTWKHRLIEEEIEIFRPDLSYEEFVEAQQGSSETSLGEAAAVETTIRGHYEAIGDNDFEEAYSYFGPTLRSRTEEETWIDDEESYDITSSTVYSVEVEEVSESTATATVDVSFEDNIGNPRFEITWKVVKEDGEWKLDKQLEAEQI